MEKNGYFWLASNSVYCHNAGVYFRLWALSRTNLNNQKAFDSDKYAPYDSASYYVRPVVTLELGIKLSGTGENIGTLENPYIISK